MIYLDNAATSWPKPFAVIEAVNRSLSVYGANPGRGGYQMSVDASVAVFGVREQLNEFFDGYGPETVCFTQNCTQALNTVIRGTLRPGDHVLISSLEHNAVARPVHALTKSGEITYDVFPVFSDVSKTGAALEEKLRPNTALIVVTAVSNVFGTILPIKELAEAAHRHRIPICVDGAQAAGVLPLKMRETGIDFLCVPGHKGLLGPMGTGALLTSNLALRPLLFGGTGTGSLSLDQPPVMPEMLESGTLNVPGIIGLGKGIETVAEMGVNTVYETETALCRTLCEGLRAIPGITVYGNGTDTPQAPLVSFDLEGRHSEDVASALADAEIAVRGGYHCAALAHRFAGTTETGTVRVSPSFANSQADINKLLNLVEKIAFYKNL